MDSIFGVEASLAANETSINLGNYRYKSCPA